MNRHNKLVLHYYKNIMIAINNRNDSGQYYKTKIMIVFTILAKAMAIASPNYYYKWRS